MNKDDVLIDKHITIKPKATISLGRLTRETDALIADDDSVMCEDCGNWKSNCQCNLVDDVTEDKQTAITIQPHKRLEE